MLGFKGIRVDDPDDVAEAWDEALAAFPHLLTLSAAAEPSGAPAWKRIPSWYLLVTADNVVLPAQQRAMA